MGDGMTDTQKPLSGIKVLELGRLIAAPFCAQLLADLGADVIKIERPGRGDEARHYGPPFLQDADGKDTVESAFYLSINRNKRAMTLDFAQPEGQRILSELVRQSDIFIENYKVGTLARYGLDYEAMKKINPKLIYVSVTGFGPSGPYAGRAATDVIVQGMSGIMSVNGHADGTPQRVGVSLVDLSTGMYAAMGAMAALRHREVQDGDGQQVSVSLLDVGLALMSGRATEFFLTGKLPAPAGSIPTGSAPAALFECDDGILNVQASGDPDFKRLCQVLDMTYLVDHPDYSSRPERARHGRQLLAILRPAFKTRKLTEIYEALIEAQVMCSPVYNVRETFEDPHIQARGRKIQRPHPLTEALPMIVSPMELSATPIDRYRAPPTLSENTTDVLQCDLGMTPQDIAELRKKGVI